MTKWFTGLNPTVQAAFVGGTIAAVGAIIVAIVTTCGSGGSGPQIIIIFPDSKVEAGEPIVVPITGEQIIVPIEGPPGANCDVTVTDPDGEERSVSLDQIPEDGVIPFLYEPEDTGEHEVQATCLVQGETIATSVMLDVVEEDPNPTEGGDTTPPRPRPHLSTPAEILE